MAIILLTLMGIIPIVFSQAITTTDCGTNKACHKSPGSCTSSTDCNYLVTWKRKTSDNNIIEFEVSTKMATGWVALAFNPTGNVMIDSRGEICYIDAGAAKFKGFHATARSRPTFVTPATNTVLSGVNVVNGAIVCRDDTIRGNDNVYPMANVLAGRCVLFSRPITPSGYQNALGPAVNLVVAAGAVSGGTVGYHGANRYAPSGTTIDFTAFAGATTQAPTTTNTQAPTTTTQAPTTPQASSSSGSQSTSSAAMTSATMSTQNSTMKATMSSDTGSNSTTKAVNSTNAPLQTTIDLNECGKTKGCFKIPSGCKTSDACTFIATWQANANKNDVMFEVKGSGSSWVAFGLNALGSKMNVVVVALKERLMKAGVLAASMDPFGFYRGRLLLKMPGTYGEICYMSGSTGIIKGFHAPKKRTPTFTASKPNGVTLHSITKPNGAFICRYTRSVAKTDGTLSISINKELYIVLASGDAVNGGTPGYHGSKRGFSSAKFDVTSRQWGGNNANRQSVSVPALVMIGALQMMLLKILS